MHFEYSKNPIIQKRVNILKRARFTFLAIIFLLLLNYLLFAINSNNLSILIIVSVICILLSFLISGIYSFYISTITKESLERELNPELLLNLSIWSSKVKLVNKRNYYYALNNIALAYIHDGKYDEAKEVLEYLEKQKLDKLSKSLVILKKIEILFYENKYDEIKGLKDDLLFEIDGLNLSLKNKIIFELEMYIAMVKKDKDKLKNICNTLEKSKSNLDHVYSIYIKSLFFEEEDNKYQKMLAFEGGNLFIARKEFTDQDITTKNNIKPNEHTVIKVYEIVLLLSQIILLILNIIVNF